MRLLEKMIMKGALSPFYVYLLHLGLPLWIAGGLTVAQVGNLYLDIDLSTPEARCEVEYQESLENVENPGRGFYAPVYVHYQQTDNQIPDFDEKLVHLRLDVAEFSGSYNKKRDEELSEDMLLALDGLLAEMERKQENAIVRFSYDPWFSGKKTYEPSMEMILRHQEQIGEVLSRRSEVVISVECGIFGKWGEMHGSDACTQENFNQVIDKWLEVLPESIPISVRTPGQYCGWCGVERSELAGQVTQKGQKEYRVGIYDDGYLGSETDLGTYVDREAEVNWLFNQARHTVFGGEAGSAGGQHGEVGFTTTFLEKEAFLTHTTYLNLEWNQKLINALKRETYQGSEERYQGSDGYVYLKNHMGYRFVIRGVKMSSAVPLGKRLKLEMEVENVGFANLVKPKNLTLILVREDETYQFQLTGEGKPDNVRTENCDPTAWDSREVTSVWTRIAMPEEMPTGEYQVYLRIAAPSMQGSLGEIGYPVRFANEDDIWNATLGATFLGTFQVTEKEKTWEWDFKEGVRIKEIE